MLSRFTVMVCVSMAVVGGKLRFFVRETSRSFALYFRHRLCFLGANYCTFFYDCSGWGSLGEDFAHGGEFHLAFLVVVAPGHGVETVVDPSL